MDTSVLSKKTHEKIMEAMDITGNISQVRKIVTEAKTEKEIMEKLEKLLSQKN